MSDPDGFISTGSLPPPSRVQALVDDAHRRFEADDSGSVSDVYPILKSADPRLLGICVASVDGELYGAGDTTIAFPLMSVAKPFTFALACEVVGTAEAARRVGVDATGLPFNSLEAVERGGGRTNPMVNSGAIATIGLLGDAPWDRLTEGLSRFAGHELSVDAGTYASATATNLTNRALTHLLDSFAALDGDPMALLDVYTRQSCLSVTCEDLAVMGATLASGGVNPRTRERVVSAETCHATLAVMATAGLYETSGDWLYRVGLPGKSGIGGGIVTVSPGKGGLGTFSPLLDGAGNSMRGQAVAEFLSRQLGLDIFAT